MSSVKNNAGELAIMSGSYPDNCSDWYQTSTKSTSCIWWRSNPFHILPELQVLPCVSWRVGWMLWFCFLSCPMYSCMQISYCDSQNLNYHTSLYFVDVLGAFIIKKNLSSLFSHAGNEHQWSFANVGCCIMHNGSGDLLWTSISGVFATNLDNWKSNMLPVILSKCVLSEHQCCGFMNPG